MAKTLSRVFFIFRYLTSLEYALTGGIGPGGNCGSAFPRASPMSAPSASVPMDISGGGRHDPYGGLPTLGGTPT